MKTNHLVFVGYYFFVEQHFGNTIFNVPSMSRVLTHNIYSIGVEVVKAQLGINEHILNIYKVIMFPNTVTHAT
jgi:hypothetical protein